MGNQQPSFYILSDDKIGRRFDGQPIRHGVESKWTEMGDTLPSYVGGTDMTYSNPELTGIYKGGNSWRVLKCVPAIRERIAIYNG